jgi:hypothetical protein
MAILAIGAAFAAAASAGAYAVGATATVIATAASIGFTVGSTLGTLLFPASQPYVIGARITDLQIQAASYGTPIPLGYGVFRTPGVILWGLPIEERSTTEETGGKGKSGGGEITNYTYWGHIAIGFCAGPIDEFRRVWCDGKLVYDATSLPATEKYPGELRFYVGDEAQLPDSLMEADKGAGNVPAYRGFAYLVAGVGHGFPLADFGNRYPTFTVEICRAPASA